MASSDWNGVQSFFQAVSTAVKMIGLCAKTREEKTIPVFLTGFRSSRGGMSTTYTSETGARLAAVPPTERMVTELCEND